MFETLIREKDFLSEIIPKIETGIPINSIAVQLDLPQRLVHVVSDILVAKKMLDEADTDNVEPDYITIQAKLNKLETAFMSGFEHMKLSKIVRENSEILILQMQKIILVLKIEVEKSKIRKRGISKTLKSWTKSGDALRNPNFPAALMFFRDEALEFVSQNSPNSKLSKSANTVLDIFQKGGEPLEVG